MNQLKHLLFILISFQTFGQVKTVTLTSTTIEGFTIKHAKTIADQDTSEQLVISYKNPKYQYADDWGFIFIDDNEELIDFINQIDKAIVEIKLKEKSTVYFYPQTKYANFYLVKYDFSLLKIYIYATSDLSEDIGRSISIPSIQKMKDFLKKISINNL